MHELSHRLRILAVPNANTLQLWIGVDRHACISERRIAQQGSDQSRYLSALACVRAHRGGRDVDEDLYEIVVSKNGLQRLQHLVAIVPQFDGGEGFCQFAAKQERRESEEGARSISRRGVFHTLPQGSVKSNRD